MENPHDQWADFYDLAYEAMGKTLYTGLTEKTLREIDSIAKPPGRVLDLGAGTGRLAIPLAKKGYKVTAVEGSKEMCAVLREKAKKAGVDIQIVNRDMTADLRPEVEDGTYDIVVCVFTTLNYITTADQMQAFFQNTSRALRPGGKALISFIEDMSPMQAAYNPRALVGDRGKDRIERRISIQGQTPRFEYNEVSKGIQDNKRFHFDTVIPLREWQGEEVIKILSKEGLRCCANLTQKFIGSGETYLLLERSVTK